MATVRRVNVSIPMDVALSMRRHPSVNWSSVATRAFSETLRQIGNGGIMVSLVKEIELTPEEIYLKSRSDALCEVVEWIESHAGCSTDSCVKAIREVIAPRDILFDRR